MQRQIIHGVPYFTDVQNRLYTWEPEGSPSHIGTYDPVKKSVDFLPNHQAILDEKLATWRRTQHTRSRKPAAASASTDADATDETTGADADAEGATD